MTNTPTGKDKTVTAQKLIQQCIAIVICKPQEVFSFISPQEKDEITTINLVSTEAVSSGLQPIKYNNIQWTSISPDNAIEKR